MNSKNVVLIGFMGTGKSSVGKALAKLLGRTWVDIDQMVEKESGKKISEIFEAQGEAAFRKLEKEAVRELSEKDELVITTGGGAVVDVENFEMLQKNAVMIALFASPETVFSRVKDSRHRPLLQTPDVLGEIERLMALRLPTYEKAEYQFKTDGLRPGEVAELILKTVKL